MSSKTFKSAKSNLELGVVRSNEGYLRIWVGEPDHKTFGLIDLAPSDAPALALAVLEAAGVEPDREPLECQVSLGTIVADLQGTIQYAEALASANREQAKLEAEALELFNVVREHDGEPRVATWDGFHAGTMEVYLLLARRAREMRAEK